MRVWPGDVLTLGRARLQQVGSVMVEADWLGDDGGAVVRLALAIAEEGRFGRLPELAVALAAAGCADADLLAC